MDDTKKRTDLEDEVADIFADDSDDDEETEDDDKLKEDEEAEDEI